MGLRVEFFGDEVSFQLDGLFNSQGVHGTLAGKDDFIDIMCKFICVFVGMASRDTKDGALKNVNSSYYELFAEVYGRLWGVSAKPNEWMV